MTSFRQEIREFVRASATVLSIQNLSPEERGAVLVFIEHMTKMLSDKKVSADGNDREGTHDGESMAAF